MVRGLPSIALLVAPAWAAGAAVPLSFDGTFATRGEPAQVHYQAVYRAGGQVHHLDVWRDGDRRIARITDGAIRTYARHRAGDADYRMTVLDTRRRLRTDVDRTNLYRIGGFVDWFDLGHGLRHPRGSYRLTTLSAGPPSPAPARPCRWYALIEGGRTTSICWSASARLPMLVAGADARLVWRVLSVSDGPIPAARFAIDDRGFVRVDADQDIEKD